MSHVPPESPTSALARSVAIIADGNRRWARARGLPAIAGHCAGVDTAWQLVRHALVLGIDQLVVFAFSTENWQRPPHEVDALFDLFGTRVVPEARLVVGELGVRVRFIGRLDLIPVALQRDMRAAERITASGCRMALFIAFNYGGRAELLDAARDYKGGGERELRGLLYAPEMRDPDVLIRTGGDQRLSNFLLWQAADTELVFRDELFPDFTRKAFEASLTQLNQQRDRGSVHDVYPPTIKQGLASTEAILASGASHSRASD